MLKKDLYHQLNEMAMQQLKRKYPEICDEITRDVANSLVTEIENMAEVESLADEKWRYKQH